MSNALITQWNCRCGRVNPIEDRICRSCRTPLVLTKHTPGPWIAEFREKAKEWWIGISPKQGSLVCAIKVMKYDFEQDEANARLIAAAPDMLDALRLILSEVSCFCEETSEGGYRCPLHDAEEAAKKAGGL